jgi:hypothetical protein
LLAYPYEVWAVLCVSSCPDLVEEIIVGYFHGLTSQEVLSEMAGGALPQGFAVSVLML